MKLRSMRSAAALSALTLGSGLGILHTATPASASCYQSGVVSPPDYQQDNSGVSGDITNNIQYTPEQYGAPAGAQILVQTVTVSPTYYRGAAEVRYPVFTPNAISFQVWTQAASNGFLGIGGHHSGGVIVHTSFMWYSTACG